MTRGGISSSDSPGDRRGAEIKPDERARSEAEALFAAPSDRRRKKAKARFEGLQGTVAVHVLDCWWRGARAGEELVYCEALDPIRDETWRRVGDLARRGLLRAHERLRAGGGKQWFVVRTSKPADKQADPMAAALADPPSDIIYRAFKRAANLALPCPSDGDLARMAGLDMRQAAAWRVRRLIRVRLIESTQVYEGGVPARVVTILAARHAGLAAGKSTALPRKWRALQEAALKDAAAAAAAGGQR